MALESALSELLFEDDMLNEVKLPFLSHAPLSEDRKVTYARCIGMVEEGATILAAKFTNFDGSILEQIVNWNEAKGVVKKVTCECGVSMEEFSPTCIVEYQYAPNEDWRLSKVSRQPLEMYMGSKFAQWRSMLDAPTCEAAFVRMLQAGALNKIYDKLAFPLPDADKDAWVITDEKTGKLVDIPRQVHALRIWNATEDRYDDISPLLAGAPASDEDLAVYWQTTLDELRKKNGQEYIDGLLAKGRA